MLVSTILQQQPTPAGFQALFSSIAPVSFKTGHGSNTTPADLVAAPGTATVAPQAITTTWKEGCWFQTKFQTFKHDAAVGCHQRGHRGLHPLHT